MIALWPEGAISDCNPYLTEFIPLLISCHFTSGRSFLLSRSLQVAFPRSDEEGRMSMLVCLSRTIGRTNGSVQRRAATSRKAREAKCPTSETKHMSLHENNVADYVSRRSVFRACGLKSVLLSMTHQICLVNALPHDLPCPRQP